MENIIFEIVTKCGLTILGIVAFAIWSMAGFPLFTITFEKKGR